MQTQASTSTPPAKPLRYATYKGRQYVLVFMGPTNYGVRAKLAFLNGAKEFWVAADQVEECATPPASPQNPPPTARAAAMPQQGFVADLPLPDWPCDTTVLCRGYPYRFQMAFNTKFGQRARVAYTNAAGETRERLVELSLLEFPAATPDETQQPEYANAESLDNAPPPNPDFVPDREDDGYAEFTHTTPPPRPRVSPKVHRKCDVCGDRQAEVPHPETPDAMLCQVCFEATDVPF